MAKTASGRGVSMAIEAGNAAGPRTRVRFGSATYRGPKPEASVVARNIEAGQAALARGLKALVKPGVKLKLKKGVPLFSADPTDPTILIREVDGKRDRVVLEGGVFKVVA